MNLSERLDQLQGVTERGREILFSPFLRFCRSVGITGNHITTFRLFLALLFPFLIVSRPALAWWLMAISIFLDAVDGTVARFEKLQGDRGKFIDVLADQLTFVFLGLGLIRIIPAFALVLACLSIGIPALYLMVSVAANEGKPSDWIITCKSRLTGYKIMFLIIIIGFLTNGWNQETTMSLLWIETIVVGTHFSWHYLSFVSKRNLWRT